MIAIEIIQTAVGRLHSGERCLVFNNDVELINNLPDYYAPSNVANLDYAALEASELAIFEYLANDHVPIGYGLVLEVRDSIANILFMRFPKEKNSPYFIVEDDNRD